MLLLFDIDGTLLIDAAGEHAAALVLAMEKVYGVSDLHNGGMVVAGHTDPAIARRYLMLADVDARRIDDRLPLLAEQAGIEFARLCPDDLSDRLSPGIDGTLDHLAREHQFGLVTGNLEPIAHLKLKRAGIGHHFPHGQGGFGSDHEDRTELPAIARRRAGGVAPREAVVIGDTPRDIACARADGCRVIAIATGPFGVDELASADAVVRHADELPAAIAAL